MGPGTLTGTADIADTLQCADIRACFCADNAHVAVKRAVPRMMGNYNIIPQDIIKSGSADSSSHCSPNRRAVICANVYPRMKLTDSGKGVVPVAIG